MALSDSYSYVIERWRKGKFQEVVHTEYVLLEVNGLFTYTYSLSARSALCRAQPQNWTTVMQPAGGEGRSAWHREVRPPSVPTRGPGDTSWAARWRPLVTPTVRGRAPCAAAPVPPPQIRAVRPQTPAPRGPGGRGPKATVTAASVSGPGPPPGLQTCFPPHPERRLYSNLIGRNRMFYKTSLPQG
nr:MAPK-interacting and spindle-stabilizing protein-like isoform X2 [Manis javanica]XP_036874479.1 MAPK-interacting and spindle-stabilizing protein-like isoform X2 [Manis javanica]